MTEPVNDECAVSQLNDYAMTKWVNEMQIRNSALQHDTETVVVRLFNTYGPGEYYSPYRSVNCRFLFCALHGRPWTVFRGHSRTSREARRRSLPVRVHAGTELPARTPQLTSGGRQPGRSQRQVRKKGSSRRGQAGRLRETALRPRAKRQRPPLSEASARFPDLVFRKNMWLSLWNCFG